MAAFTYEKLSLGETVNAFVYGLSLYLLSSICSSIIERPDFHGDIGS